jgi:hypothetical protein
MVVNCLIVDVRFAVKHVAQGTIRVRLNAINVEILDFLLEVYCDDLFAFSCHEAPPLLLGIFWIVVGLSMCIFRLYLVHE